jgi:hypothetical protein
MKSTKCVLIGGAAIGVTTAGAHADELSDMKAQIEALNARVVAVQTAPAVPAGYQLLAITRGEPLQVPGMIDSDRDRVVDNSATIISILPTADAPDGVSISWSGYVRAAVVYSGASSDATLKRSYTDIDGVKTTEKTKLPVTTDDDWDVLSRGQLRVVAKTDTAIGEVGVELKMRADFNDNGPGYVYMKTAWGFWAMTPELTFGGGYNKSLGNIGYGYDGACTCYYTDRADVNFDPGDTTQLRLSYASGPFSMAVALEDSGKNNGFGNYNDYTNGQNLGVAGVFNYLGDAFSGEISGVYRTVNGDDYSRSGPVLSAVSNVYDSNVDSLWQVGAGVGFDLGDIASFSLAAALGSGPFDEVNSQGDIVSSYPVQNDWWGVSGLASANLSDSFHAEVGVGYKHRETDGFTGLYDADGDYWYYSGLDWNQFAVLGGAYYTPVDQLTIGLEGEWYTTDSSISRIQRDIEGERTGYKDRLDDTEDNWTVDLVSVWRF